MSKDDTLKRLKAGGLVLIAGDSRVPDASYLKMFRGDLLVLISPELLNVPTGIKSKAAGDLIVQPGIAPAPAPALLVRPAVIQAAPFRVQVQPLIVAPAPPAEKPVAPAPKPADKPKG